MRGGRKIENERGDVCDGRPPTALPVAEQIGHTAEHSDCRGDGASADRWLPPRVEHWAVLAFSDWKYSYTHIHTHFAQSGNRVGRRKKWRTGLF